MRFASGSISGRGATLAEQIRNAVARAALDIRFTGPIVDGELDRVSLEIWILSDVCPIPHESRQTAGALTLGIEGIEVEHNGRSAYFKPSVAITYRFPSPESLFRALCRQAGLPEEAWKGPTCHLRKTGWIHLSRDIDASSTSLVALRRRDPVRIGEAAVKGWITDGAEYLVNHQKANGDYTYLYDPIFGLPRSDRGNDVRAAGCTYAMALAAGSAVSSTSADRWRRSAMRSAQALLATMVESADGDLFIPEQDPPGPGGGKLGTVALLALSLSCPSLRGTYARDRERLLWAIRRARREDGTFRCRLGSGEEVLTHANYYPGQALLALALAAEQGDEAALSCCRDAFAPYRKHFTDDPQTGFILWQLDVWRRMAMLDDRDPYAEFVFQMIDWLLPLQIGPEGRAEHQGGFRGGGPGSSACVYTEAIARAATLAQRVGDASRWVRYRDATIAGLRFCSRLILGDDQRPFVADPLLARGGVTKNLGTFDVRCDNVQHLITLALAVLGDPALLGGS